jgi:hypothetical protein
MNERWTLVKSFPGSHKYFRDNRNNRLAIADYSGETPDKTDDGILYVDTKSPIIVSWHRGGDTYSIPLIEPDGSKTVTPSDPDAVQWLCSERGMQLHRNVNPSARAGSSQWAICR